MSDLLSIGLSGVRAYQTALTTTSENIANAGTVGYARRSASVSEVAAVSSAGTTTGLGVTVTGLARAADAHRSAEVRNAGSDLARSETGVTWMERIETVLSGNKLADRLTSFFNASKAVAADPASLAPRAAMLEAASSAASAFSATGAALDGAFADLEGGVDAAVTQLNSLSAALAKVNNGLGRTSPGTSGNAALLDERDRLLEQMSAITDVGTSFDAAGRVSVRVGGPNGPALVEGAEAATVTFVLGDQGELSLAAHRGGETLAMHPAGGALAGLAEGAQRIADARDAVATQAEAFASGVNTIQGQGRDMNGVAGEAFFDIGEPGYKLTLALSDPRGIAAAAPGAGMRDNSNLAKLDTLRTTGAFEEKINALTTTNASALSARRGVAEAQTAMRDAAVAARDSVSGVNVDEEAVDLLRFQQAYQASSRVIQIARDTLQSILDIR